MDHPTQLLATLTVVWIITILKLMMEKSSTRIPSKVDTSSYQYGAHAAVLLDQETRGGNNIFVDATGPYAHLFLRLHEQNYAAEVTSKIREYSSLRRGTRRSRRL